VIVKLTPNITNVVMPARAALAGGAHGLSLINTLNSIIAIDLDTLEITPSIGGKGGHGGYAGPAVKPIALNMLAALASDETVSRAAKPISGMGGISTWRDAAEFLLLGATSLQVCTAVMHYGFRIVEDLCDGLSQWMDAKGFANIAALRGASLSRISDFKDLDLSFRAVARIDTASCIKCDLCYVACNDTAHQCIDLIATTGERPQPRVREDDCVGCRLCYNVCPVEGCISMVELDSGRSPVTWDQLVKNRPEVTADWDAMKKYRSENGIEIH
jgi:dihydropyrimidine dehydrogenase (NAD+) subunit PreA